VSTLLALRDHGQEHGSEQQHESGEVSREVVLLVEAELVRQAQQGLMAEIEVRDGNAKVGQDQQREHACQSSDHCTGVKRDRRRGSLHTPPVR
jgi:hypothetical protein